MTTFALLPPKFVKHIGSTLAPDTWVKVKSPATAETLARMTHGLVVSEVLDTHGVQLVVHHGSRRIRTFGGFGGHWVDRGKRLPFEDRNRLGALRVKKNWAAMIDAFLGVATAPLPVLKLSEAKAVPQGDRIVGAIIQKNWAALASLLDGAPNLHTRDRRTLASELIAAAIDDDAAKVKGLVSAGVSPDLLDNEGFAALHYTLEPQMIALLVDLGADPEVRSRRGERPLFSAVRNVTPRSAEQVKALLKAGADPSRGDLIVALRAFVKRQAAVSRPAYAKRARELEALLKKALPRSRRNPG